MQRFLAGVILACAFGANASALAVSAVEYYNASLDHYFVTANAAEIETLDGRGISGWSRTGQSFGVFTQASDAPAGFVPVCRYYIPPEHGDSHFFSASSAECAAVASRIGTDSNYSGYVLETAAAFYVLLPDASTGACPAATRPVYRLWNRRADSNHRYTIDAGVRATMLARGYLAEGYGPDGVAMCAPDVAASIVRASGPTPWPLGCDRESATSVLYLDSEVEPYVAADPRNAGHLVGVWQQDRWADGGARGIVTASSIDGGRAWITSSAPLSRCTGGADIGADYARVSDPWITFSPDGTAYQIAIAFTGPTFGVRSSNAVLVSRSTDGLAWSAATALIRDGRTNFNDKETITADPVDARFVYAVWDRIDPSGAGPAWFARTADGGITWDPAHAIYDPGPSGQTFNNAILVQPGGTLVDLFTQFTTDPTTKQTTAALELMHSSDHGLTWSAPDTITALLPVGVKSPNDAAEVRDAAYIVSAAVGRDGKIALAWQDARSSGGVRDGILFSQSTDGGATWSSPVQINAVPQVQAFTPALTIGDDGTIAIAYYDFRNDTPGSLVLSTDYWLTQSADGVHWRETHVAGPFDLALAPEAQGLFLGDYQGLASAGPETMALFAVTTGSNDNRTDIVATRTGAATGAKSSSRARLVQAQPVATPSLTAHFRGAVHASALRTLQRRKRPPPQALWLP